MKEEFIAHVREIAGEWTTQSMDAHLQQVAALAGTFANEFGNRDWGELMGYWHDLGKYHPGWQRYLRTKSGYDPEAHLENVGNRPNHSTAGAVLALSKAISPEGRISPIAKILAYTIAGHHAGLPDWFPDKAGGDLCGRIFKGIESPVLDTGDLDAILQLPGLKALLEMPFPKSPPPLQISPSGQETLATEHLHLWIRMLFSCLVDADFLDTERFMKPEKFRVRANYESLAELKARFDRFMQEKERSVPDTPLNRKRATIQAICREKASHAPGFFSLTVPTGGGKTLASMAFALEHALQHGKKRIITAIPYTSIIEQTAKVFKYGTDNDKEIESHMVSGKSLFGKDQVIEHHSNLEEKKETPASRLACENWDAPIIVTTNVQLFESLFASKSSSCRKLHNIANSVIILDEVQMLPPDFLKPILSVLNGLVAHFKVSVVMMTATQPALEGTVGQPPNIISGIRDVRPIIENPDSLAKEFKRVEVKWPENLQDKNDWESIRDQLLHHDRVLCIVNSRSDCRDLHRLMPFGTIHLSGLMCGEERSFIISEIKEKLKEGEPVRVISTQLVEAGVDIDFPVVYRALAGFDSIAQAAGRCNRENRLEKNGQVVVFIPPKPSPPGLLRKGEYACRDILWTRTDRDLSPHLFEQYFKHFYDKLNEVDKPRFYERLIRDAEGFDFSFRTLAQDFNLISDDQQSIVVWYQNPQTGNSSFDLIKRLKSEGPSRALMRGLQRFLVNIPVNIFNRMSQLGFVDEVSGYWVQNSQDLYKPGTGLELDEFLWAGDSVT